MSNSNQRPPKIPGLERAEPQSKAAVRPLPATVAKILDDFTVVINRGSDDGIAKGQSFLVYGIEDDEIIDPETNESLGVLEVVRGRGVVSHVQQRVATLKCSEKTPGRRIKRRPLGILSISDIVEEDQAGDALPFEEPQIGDKAKPL